MKPIKADHGRFLQLTGVPDPVSRPVDIDQLQTGFASLRSLRIYRFTAGSVIDGHAEDDEVLIVVLAGSVHLSMSEGDLTESSPEFELSAVGDSHEHPCAAYLPPGGAYRLTPRRDAEVAYARATPTTKREPTVFSTEAQPSGAGLATLCKVTSYPQFLRLRVLQTEATHDDLAISLSQPSEIDSEALVHVRSEPSNEVMTVSAAGAQPISLESWDTIPVLPGQRLTLHVAQAASALLLVVFATP